jgi:hypothetical protein
MTGHNKSVQATEFRFAPDLKRCAPTAMVLRRR